MVNIQIVLTPAPIAMLEQLVQSSKILLDAQAAAALVMLELSQKVSNTVIGAQAADQALLQLKQVNSQFVLDVVPMMRGAKGDTGGKPAHRWVGTSISFENSDGVFGELVDLKGVEGVGINSYPSDPLAFYLLSRG